MTKKLFAKGMLKGELQVCHYCIYWGGTRYFRKWCAKQGKKTNMFDDCPQWQWDKTIEKYD